MCVLFSNGFSPLFLNVLLLKEQMFFPLKTQRLTSVALQSTEITDFRRNTLSNDFHQKSPTVVEINNNNMSIDY